MAGMSWLQASLSILSGIAVALLSGYVTRVRDNQRWLNNEVYGQLYNEIDAVANGTFPREISNLQSSWSSISSYHRFRVDEELREKLDEFSNNIHYLSNDHLKLKDEQKTSKQLPDEMTDIRPSGQVALQVMRPWDKEIGGTRGLSQWLDKFAIVIFESRSPDEMRENLFKVANSAERQVFEGWDEHISGWEEPFFNAFHNDDTGFIGDRDDFIKMRDEKLPKLAADIRSELEQRIEQGILREIFQRFYNKIS